MDKKMVELSGFGSATGVPDLPEGFATTFTSHRVDTGEIALHIVTGGRGRPLLLLAGWPQCWFAWRHIMPRLSESYHVIAVDPRGVGLSDKPRSGYDVDTLSRDMFGLMDALGFERFAMVGHDIGEWVGYAMAADRPERIARIVLGEAIIPGISPSPPLISDDRHTSDFLWHFNFNRAIDINEALVRGREQIYFQHQFQTKAGTADAIPEVIRRFYAENISRDPEALRASFDYYRAIDESIPQFRRRSATKITMPVLTFAGDLACGPLVEQEIALLASDVTSVIIPNCGHYPAEEQPEALLAALEPFLAIYREECR